MKAKWIQALASVVLLLVVTAFLMQYDRQAQSADQENHCFTCHTNPRKLIEITRQIAKSQKAEPSASAETEGEG